MTTLRVIRYTNTGTTEEEVGYLDLDTLIPGDPTGQVTVLDLPIFDVADESGLADAINEAILTFAAAYTDAEIAQLDGNYSAFTSSIRNAASNFAAGILAAKIAAQ